MFSGLIHYNGRVAAITQHAQGGILLQVEAPLVIADGVVHGDSIAVNGVCLTVIAFDTHFLSFEVIPESLRRSTLISLVIDQLVNIELSLRMGDRLGGHLVYAHVDTTTPLISSQQDGQGMLLRFDLPAKYERYVVEKGYVALDGVSLTVASVDAGSFCIAMIPETAKATTLGTKKPGDLVNLELDPVARYAIDRAELYMRAATVDRQ